MRLSRDVAALAALTLAGVSGCGARTGLEAPSLDDAGSAATLDDVPLTCTPGRFRLSRRSVEVVFVIDRSGSMNDDLEGGTSRPRRWDVLRDALRATAPRYQRDTAMGLLVFPRRFDGSAARSCDITRALAVEPARDAAADVLEVLDTTEPWGATPTHAALDFAGTSLVSRISRSRAVAMVLATDGGPNCNAALSAQTCTCTARDAMGRPDCQQMPASCLDDTRTAALLRGLLARGVPTFVIGLDRSVPSFERDALERLARAGGRPDGRPGMPAYYSARSADAVRAVFDAVQRNASACTLATPSRPSDPDLVRVTVGGAEVARDATHTNGWDWTDISYGQIAFFGAACQRVAAPGSVAEVVVRCDR